MNRVTVEEEEETHVVDDEGTNCEGGFVKGGVGEENRDCQGKDERSCG